MDEGRGHNPNITKKESLCELYEDFFGHLRVLRMLRENGQNYNKKKLKHLKNDSKVGTILVHSNFIIVMRHVS